MQSNIKKSYNQSHVKAILPLCITLHQKLCVEEVSVFSNYVVQYFQQDDQSLIHHVMTELRKTQNDPISTSLIYSSFLDALRNTHLVGNCSLN